MVLEAVEPFEPRPQGPSEGGARLWRSLGGAPWRFGKKQPLQQPQKTSLKIGNLLNIAKA